MGLAFRIIVVALLIAAGVAVHDRITSVQLGRLSPADASLPVGVYHLRSALSPTPRTPLKGLATQAQASGLNFVIVTDLGEQMAGPVDYEALTVLTAAELETSYGRVVQFDMEGVLDERFYSQLDVLDAIRGQGGLPLISHPEDRKRPWDGSFEGVGGIEIANLASSARDVAGRLFQGWVTPLIASKLNPELAMAQLYRRNEAALAHWDETSSPEILGICGVDSEGRLPIALNFESWHLVLDEALDDSDPDYAAQLVARIRAGRFYCAAALFGSRPYLRFGALSNNEWVAGAGDSLPGDTIDEIVIFGPEAKGTETTLVLLRSGEEVARAAGRELHYRRPLPGTYRAEVRIVVPNVFFGSHSVTAIYSNRIRIEPH